MLTVNQLEQMLGPKKLAEYWFPHLTETFETYKITSLNDIAAFMANACHESQNFTRLEENLNYSNPNRILQLWPRRILPENAIDLCNNPKKLANKVYSNKLGNGDEKSGDGWKYRGRGIFQLTGKDNYHHYGEMLGIDLVKLPDQLLNPKYAALSAGAYWDDHELNGFHFFEEVVRTITGKKLTGLPARSSLYIHFQRILRG